MTKGLRSETADVVHVIGRVADDKVGVVERIQELSTELEIGVLVDLHLLDRAPIEPGEVRSAQHDVAEAVLTTESLDIVIGVRGSDVSAVRVGEAEGRA